MTAHRRPSSAVAGLLLDPKQLMHPEKTAKSSLSPYNPVRLCLVFSTIWKHVHQDESDATILTKWRELWIRLACAIAGYHVGRASLVDDVDGKESILLAKSCLDTFDGINSSPAASTPDSVKKPKMAVVHVDDIISSELINALEELVPSSAIQTQTQTSPSHIDGSVPKPL